MSRLSSTSGSLSLSAILDDNNQHSSASISSKSTISNTNSINIHVSPTPRKAARLTMQSYFDKENRLSSDKALSPKSKLTPLKQTNQNVLNRQSVPDSIKSLRSLKSASTAESPSKKNFNRRSYLSQKSYSSYSSSSQSNTNRDSKHSIETQSVKDIELPKELSPQKIVIPPPELKNQSSDDTSESIKTVKKSTSFRSLRNSLSMKSLASTLTLKQEPQTSTANTEKRKSVKMKKKMSLENIRSFLSNNRYSMSHDSSNNYKNNISLPIMQPQTKDKIRNRLRNSSSIVSLSSFASDENNISTNTIAVDLNQIHFSLLLKLCNQQKIITFKSYMNKFQASNNRRHLTLIKNNVSSDNLLLHEFTSNDYNNGSENNDHISDSNFKYSSVWKIIPFDYDSPTFLQIIQELALTISMSKKEGFVSIISATVVSGPLPNSILDIIDNNYPNFQACQYYLIMKLKYGGVSLSKFKIQSWQDASIIFKNILNAICAGSEEYYEHRDLNADNILIERSINEDSTEHENSNKFEIAIIDHALARGVVSNQLMFRNLYDAEFFKGNGEYRHTIYKLMRRAAVSNSDTLSHSVSTLSINTLASDCNIDWSKSYPIFNLLWVHYLLHTIIYEKDLKPIKMNPIMKRNGRSMNNSNDVTKEIAAYERLLQGYRMVEPAVLFGHRKNKYMRHVSDVHEFRDWYLEI